MENGINNIEHTVPENYNHQIDIWYRINNISREKIELFHDFLVSLHNIIDTTYLGNDVLYFENDQRGHFTWCWKKTIENFNNEKIDFKERGNHYEYFWIFFTEAYYLVKIQEKEDRINSYFDKLFGFTHKKTRSELDILSELYKLLDHNLKK